MTSYEALDRRVRELNEAHFNEFQQESLRRKTLAQRNAKVQEERDKRRRDFMASIGIDLKKFDSAVQHEKRMREAELKVFLDESRSESAKRDLAASQSQAEASIRSQMMAEAGHMVLPVFASSLFASDRSFLAGIDGLGPPSAGNIDPDSMLVFPNEASKKQQGKAVSSNGSPDGTFRFPFSFGFVPFETGTYLMAATLEFHGFYYLNSKSSFWGSQDAAVTLDSPLMPGSITGLAAAIPQPS
jgi:hypothetical protein